LAPSPSQTPTPPTLITQPTLITHKNKCTPTTPSPLVEAPYKFKISPPHATCTAEPPIRTKCLPNRTYRSTTTKQGSTTGRAPLRQNVTCITYLRLHTHYLHNCALTPRNSLARNPTPHTHAHPRISERTHNLKRLNHVHSPCDPSDHTHNISRPMYTQSVVNKPPIPAFTLSSTPLPTTTNLHLNIITPSQA